MCNLKKKNFCTTIPCLFHPLPTTPAGVTSRHFNAFSIIIFK